MNRTPAPPPRSLRWSLRSKVFLVVLGVCLALVTALTGVSERTSIDDASVALTDKALNYGKLAARQLEPAIAFDDRDAARDVINALEVDADVAAVALYSVEGKLIQGEARAELFAPTATVPVVERSATRIRSCVPVVSERGGRGIVVVEMSLRELERRSRAARAHALIVIAIGVLVASVVAWVGGRYLTWRIVALARNASRVAGGDLERLETFEAGSDEIGELASAFGVMTTNLRKLIGENETRSREIGARNAQMRTLLDHVAQGFLTIDAAGQIGPERSANVERWFGELSGTMSFTDLLRRADGDTALWFELAWEAVHDGSLPVEVALDQLPKKVHHEGRTFELELTPIPSEAGEITALVVMTDVTDSLERERSMATRAEVLTVLERALEDRGALMIFLDEASELVEGLVRQRHTTLGDVKRAVHTLKGNCALFGLSSVSTFCHELETRMAELNDMPSPSALRELMARWTEATSSLVRVFAKTSKDTLEVARVDIDDLITAVSSGAARREIGRRARLLRLEPLALRLARVADSAVALGQRLQKELAVNVESGRVRFDSTAWSPFWAAFTHVVRNAVDHGIEDGDTRESLGKPRAGTLSLSAELDGGSFVLRAADDGRGIDWKIVAEKAAALGAPCATDADLEAALFVDGLSSKQDVSEISGRGIGLGAIRNACAALRGHIRVASTAGRGTTFTFIFPVESLGDAYTHVVPGHASVSVA